LRIPSATAFVMLRVATLFFYYIINIGNATPKFLSTAINATL
jgi:hypothetical protein